MMKQFYTGLILFVLTSFSLAQPTFTEHAISTSAIGAMSVYATDVDGDGDMDVLSASWNDDKIAWYENDGNSGSNGSISGTVSLLNSNQNNIAAGANHSLAILPDRSVTAWGDNSDGQSITNGLSDVKEVAGGYIYSLALHTDGTITAWGNNDFGQTDIPDELSDVIAIAAGPNHGLALLSNGTVTAWGWNNYNQSTVPAGLSDVAAIAAGDFHSLALRADGTVVTWGNSNNDVPDGLSPAIRIAAGNNHSLALHADGTVTAWGTGAENFESDYGQATVPDGLSDVIAISAGWWSSYAIHSNGTVTAWGGPSGVINGVEDLENVVAIAGGYSHSLALHLNGSITAFGTTVPEGLLALAYEPLSYAQVRMSLHLPNVDHLEQNWGENPPFSTFYEFNDPQITEGGPYEVEAYFDDNDNNMYDSGEPFARVDSLYVSASLTLTNIDLELTSSGSSGPTALEITSPSGGEIWHAGTGETIEWTSTTYDGNDYLLHIELYNEAYPYQYIETDFVSSSNGGSYYWNIPSDLSGGGNYQIKLSHPDYAMEVESNYFQIVNAIEDFIFLGEFEGHKYWSSNYPDTWQNANDWVNQYTEAHLVTITSQEENDFITNNFDGSDNWIGFTDEAEEGNWQWVTGEDVTYTNWMEGEPNNSEELEHWAHILENGEWNDLDYDLARFIIEFDGSTGDETDYPEFSNFQITSGDIYVDSTEVNFSIDLSASSGIAEAEYAYYKGGNNTSHIYGGFLDSDISSGSLSFDGIDDFVEIPYSTELDMGNMLTIAAWVYPEIILDNESTILMRGEYGYGLALTWTGDGNCSVNQAQNLVYWDQGDCWSAINSTITYEFDQWQHVAVTVEDVGDQLEIYFYVNGVEDGPHFSNESSISNGGASSDLRIGDQGGQGTNPFHGNIADLAIWNTVLFTDDIITLYDGQPPHAFADPPNAYWNFNEGSGSTLTDLSGNENNGNIEGALWSTNVPSTEIGTGTWSGSIVAGDVTAEGLMVQISAKSINGDVSWSEWYEIAPIFFTEKHFANIERQEYTMISFPGWMYGNNVVSVLEDNLGEEDRSQWRVFSYDEAYGYQESYGDFDPGKAFWIITRDDAYLSSGSGQVIELIGGFGVGLDQGWNMIGSPYDFVMSFPEQVEIIGDIDYALWAYDGTGYVETDGFTGGEGYWLYSYSDNSIISFQHEQPGSSPKILNGGWQFNLSASINGYHDSGNKLGVHPQARNERDSMDSREPPVIGDYVQLAFDNADWEDKGSYSKDIRKEGQASYIWNIAVKSNMSGHIRLDAMDAINIPLEYDALLIDLKNRLQHDLRSGETYNYVSIGDEKPHQLKVIIGLSENVSKIIDDLGILPTEFAVDQNVPNPFNPVTAIRMQLVEDAVVSMKVFNILGEEVSVLLHNAKIESGYQQVIWNGRDKFNRQLPSGLYLYQTIMKNDQGKLLHMKTKKMILVK
ncbi:MAG: hypothetical protein CMP90_07015 [Gammaproteobacteria bacterium]|nr:hypothetical protein [Gammaproteobacteria bacterium]